MKDKCLIPRCSNRKRARGWCTMHYQRWKRHGDPNIALIKKTPTAVLNAALDDALSYRGKDCLPWAFAKNKSGYAQIHIEGGRMVLVHRLICERVNGPAPTPTHQAAHSCGNGHLSCVAPYHLRWATPLENMSDMIAHGRSPRGSRNGISKLTEKQVLEIFSRVHAGEVQSKIADKFAVAQTLISQIKLGQRWGWLTRRDT